jgi:hypothetical protein
MRLLIFLLALTSAFFVSAADEPAYNPSTLQPPQKKELYTIECQNSNAAKTTIESDDSSLSICQSFWVSGESGIQALIDTHLSSGYYKSASDITWTSANTYTYDFVLCKYGDCDTFGDGDSGTSSGSATGRIKSTSYDYQCPPDNYPKNTIRVPIVPAPTGSNSPTFSCGEPAVAEDCPAGYHSKAVSAQIGGTECVPKECPPAGSGENLSSSPATGGVPFSGGGMYCNDGCAYSVPSSNITSQGYASGTSQGVACGDKPYDNKKLADEGNEGGCKTTTDSGGVAVLTCDIPADQPEGEGTDVDNGESKTDDTPTPKKPLEDCAVDDTACLLRNLQTSSENNKQDAIDNDNLLHNKLIDAITNNTNVIKNSVENLDTTVSLAHQEAARNDLVKIQKLDGIIDAIRGIEITGGGGGGTGSGGTGSGGDDCEGSAADCVPIEGSEIPSETVNLQQYADKYDDWLPNAELPEEKCIVLTTGKSICLSFEAFILLFKAISGLLVIGALMHSAKIISGAI